MWPHIYTDWYWYEKSCFDVMMWSQDALFINNRYNQKWRWFLKYHLVHLFASIFSFSACSLAPTNSSIFSHSFLRYRQHLSWYWIHKIEHTKGERRINNGKSVRNFERNTFANYRDPIKRLLPSAPHSRFTHPIYVDMHHDAVKSTAINFLLFSSSDR